MGQLRNDTDLKQKCNACHKLQRHHSVFLLKISALADIYLVVAKGGEIRSDQLLSRVQLFYSSVKGDAKVFSAYPIGHYEHQHENTTQVYLYR